MISCILVMKVFHLAALFGGVVVASPPFSGRSKFCDFPTIPFSLSIPKTSAGSIAKLGSFASNESSSISDSPQTVHAHSAISRLRSSSPLQHSLSLSVQRMFQIALLAPRLSRHPLPLSVSLRPSALSLLRPTYTAPRAFLPVLYSARPFPLVLAAALLVSSRRPQRLQSRCLAYQIPHGQSLPAMPFRLLSLRWQSPYLRTLFRMPLPPLSHPVVLAHLVATILRRRAFLQAGWLTQHRFLRQWSMLHQHWDLQATLPPMLYLLFGLLYPLDHHPHQAH